MDHLQTGTQAMAKGRPKINLEIQKLERRLATINLGLVAYFELGREAYRIKRKTERKLRKLQKEGSNRENS